MAATYDGTKAVSLRQLLSAAHDDEERIYELPGEGFSDTSNELRTLEPTKYKKTICRYGLFFNRSLSKPATVGDS